MSLDMSARQKLTESLLTDHPLAQAIALLKRAKRHLNHCSVQAQDLSTEITEFTAAFERKEQQS
ncbi:hypothetical protein [Metapseudomonas resinovorans]|uniref:hypothetical protein n=1 Tax=Metapseudomonas resinovorans TaxID=53412 RepID=UPI0004214E1D|nr:hypothetical protein [Pseudomonas resinovorans]